MSSPHTTLLWLNLMRCFYIIIAIDPLIMYWDCHSRHSEVVFSEWWFLHNNRMISLLFWFLYDFIQQQQCMRYTHTYIIHTYIHVIWDHWFLNVCWRRELLSQNNNTFSSIGRNAETLAPLHQWFCFTLVMARKKISTLIILYYIWGQDWNDGYDMKASWASCG